MCNVSVDNFVAGGFSFFMFFVKNGSTFSPSIPLVDYIRGLFLGVNGYVYRNIYVFVYKGLDSRLLSIKS